jgi:hypothetical protein
MSTALLQKNGNLQIDMNSINLAVEFIADNVMRLFCWCIAARDFVEDDFLAMITCYMLTEQQAKDIFQRHH